MMLVSPLAGIMSRRFALKETAMASDLMDRYLYTGHRLHDL